MSAEAEPPVTADAVQQRPVLVEAVPNFSEGRDHGVIGAITEALDGDGAQVLHVDSNPDANRTVVTLAGPVSAVCDALYRGIGAAAGSIDMRTQAGAHIRVGAADVVPLVCLEPDPGAVQSCVEAMGVLAARVADGLGVPIFLYESSAVRTAFRSLPRCRRGGYEALPQRFAAGLADGGLCDGPDLGPRNFNSSVARTGASVLGVRNLLVALNFTLDSSDEQLARGIASAIRSTGPEGRPHRLPGLRAMGWTMPGYDGRVQVSTNLLDFQRTPAHQVMDLIRELSPVDVVGAELIGLTPAAMLVAAAQDAPGADTSSSSSSAFLDFVAAAADDVLDAGIARLRLGHLSPGPQDFKLRVLERCLTEARLVPVER